MRLIYMSIDFPFPVNNGLRMRIWSVLEALSSEGHVITFLSFAPMEQFDTQVSSLRQICRRIEVVHHTVKSLSASGNYLERIGSLFQGTSYAAQRFVSPAMRSLVRRFITEDDAEAIVCDTIFSAANLPDIDLPIIINNHNVEYMIVKRYAESQGSPVVRAYAQIEAKRLRKWEKKICERASVCMACSESDRQILSTLAPKTQVFLVPNVVDADRYAVNNQTESRYVLFQGAMDWFPNRDGVEFFITKIFPLLRRMEPHAEFLAAGRNPPTEMLAQFSNVPGVTFTGTVPDIRPYIERAALCVVPLRIGGGTRLKILEAAAAGKAIVSTRLGAEGLDFVDGREILLADDATSFADCVASLLRDLSKRQSMGEAACRKVRELYSHQALRNSLRGALTAVARGNP
jgi:glycosyltransferase involved in cell wall biosynthesis